MAWLGVDYITQRSMQYTSKDKMSFFIVVVVRLVNETRTQ